WLLGQPFPTLAVLPLIVLAGWVGTRALLGRRRVPLGAAALTACALASLGLVSGGIQAALAPDGPAAAGRLHQLGAAVRAAAREAGSEGW
ncbi:MAG: hypothetical protein P1V36_04560, partial [Planctomycetota bacterium]|nr:hypothetical protein [Planctomycetota bacterium]